MSIPDESYSAGVREVMDGLLADDYELSDVYERWRASSTTDDERMWIDELQEDISSRIPIPPGALDLHYDLPQKEMP